MSPLSPPLLKLMYGGKVKVNFLPRAPRFMLIVAAPLMTDRGSRGDLALVRVIKLELSGSAFELAKVTLVKADTISSSL